MTKPQLVALLLSLAPLPALSESTEDLTQASCRFPSSIVERAVLDAAYRKLPKSWAVTACEKNDSTEKWKNRWVLISGVEGSSSIEQIHYHVGCWYIDGQGAECGQAYRLRTVKEKGLGPIKIVDAVSDERAKKVLRFVRSASESIELPACGSSDLHLKRFTPSDIKRATAIAKAFDPEAPVWLVLGGELGDYRLSFTDADDLPRCWDIVVID